MAPHLVEILYAIGAGEYIVGTVEYADYPAQAASIPRVGGYHGLDVERILALQADWIVVWDQGNPERDVVRMEELGLNVYRSATREIADIPAVMRHFAHVLGDEPWARRILGIRCNASRLSHAELDECEPLDDGDPVELGQQYIDIKSKMPWLNIFGGCCGSDLRHVTEIARAMTAH